MDSDVDRLLSVTEAAELLGFGSYRHPAQAVRGLCRRRRLRHVRIGRSIRVRQSDVERFIVEHTVEARARA